MRLQGIISSCFSLVNMFMRGCVLHFPRICMKSVCRLRQTYITKLVVVALLYVVVLGLVLPNSLDLSGSRHPLYYFHSNLNLRLQAAKDANTKRLQEAEKYFASLDNSSMIISNAVGRRSLLEDSFTLAVSIVTVSRNRHKFDSYEPKYLTQTVWKLHSLMRKWDQKKRQMRVVMSVCNVDSNTVSYHEAIALSKFVPMFSRFEYNHSSTVSVKEKSKQDYVFCLNQTLELHKDVDYVLVMEDDALPTDDALTVLQHVIKRHFERPSVRGELHSRQSHVAFVKFYHPERLLNFVSLQPERLPELISYAALLATLCTAVLLATQGLENGSSVDVLWRKLFLFWLIVMLACGRMRVSEWRRLATPYLYSYTPAPSCCAQAILYPRLSAQVTVDYLNSTVCRAKFSKDKALEQMLTDRKMAAYLVQPNIFLHVGVYTTLRTERVDPLLFEA